MVGEKNTVFKLNVREYIKRSKGLNYAKSKFDETYLLKFTKFVIPIVPDDISSFHQEFLLGHGRRLVYRYMHNKNKS